MAAAGAPFSIREYAARARAEGGGGWPFGGDAGALPPVEVRRFRWWEDEAAAVEDEEGEVERRMAAKRRKRSVAELFAAVPRVARGQGCGKGKASKSKPDGKENGKGKVVLAVRVKASDGKKKKKNPIGIDGLLGMQSRCLSQNSEQNTQHNAETTMRLMGKTVTLGTSTIQCRGLNNETPGLVDPSSACRISDGGRQPSGNPSHFSFVPAAIPSFVLDTSSFRTNGPNQQLELGTANNVYVHPAGWCNEGEIRHQRPVVAKHVQSNAEDMLPGSMHHRHTQTVAPESSLNGRNSIRNFMEERPAPYQSSYLTQQFSRRTPRPPVSSSASGYPVQNSPGLITQTKFTSLRPLPPSVIPSHVYSDAYAPPHGSVTAFHPPVPVPYPVSNSSSPGNAMLEDESIRWTMMGSKAEGLEHTRRSCKRPAEKDDAFLTLPKKPCTAARKELNMLPFPENGLESRGSRPDPQARGMPVCLVDEPEADLPHGQFLPTRW
ncbi:hypothetical protein BAE44_0018609 [Dichanthelium oligosanthes]|uniref:Uncharacterized protein n=1 Tax=Dichanthelium oligosanthes TaxID=888268 RepID=A0A1E5V5I8_9POAL|nr:hypothetical protein BAE44_0018609 [Dichanthelium oligosanthes]